MVSRFSSYKNNKISTNVTIYHYSGKSFHIILLLLFFNILLIFSSAKQTQIPSLHTIVSHSHYWSSEISSFDKVENRNFDPHCSCPECDCNNQPILCPRSISNKEYTVLASLESCGKYSQVASVGLVNIQSGNELSQFKYYLVDEDNKKKALKGQGFDYSSLKSGGSDSHTCVYDSNPPIRFPRDGGKAYLIAKSVNNSTVDVRFNIQMSCVVPPFSEISVIATKFEDWTKFYTGNPITFSVAFKNRFSLVDTWIQGSLFVTNYKNQPEIPVVDGLGIITFTPVGSGVVTLRLKFVPSPSMFGSVITDITTPSALAVKMAYRGSFDITPSKVIVNSEFKMKYSIYDNDGTITPSLDLRKLSFESPDVDLNCTSPRDSYGSGSVLCVASSTSTGAQIAIMMDGYIISSKTIPIVENESLWINVVVVALCIIVVIVILVITVFGFVIWRRTHPHTKLIDEKENEFDNEIVVDIDYTDGDSEHQHSQ